MGSAFGASVWYNLTMGFKTFFHELGYRGEEDVKREKIEALKVQLLNARVSKSSVEGWESGDRVSRPVQADREGLGTGGSKSDASLAEESEREIAKIVAELKTLGVDADEESGRAA